jgi:hypothetical protein
VPSGALVPLGAFGCLRVPSGALGCLRVPSGALVPLGALGCLRVPSGALGCLRVPSGAFGFLCCFTPTSASCCLTVNSYGHRKSFQCNSLPSNWSDQT